MESAEQVSIDTPDRPAFVVGLLFSEDGDWLVLVTKNRPAWQKGLRNGIGGKVEPGETPAAAMRRECIEEIGVDPDWSHFTCLEYPGALLHFFAARDHVAYMDACAQTDEDIIRVALNMLDISSLRLIPNLKWLIPMGRHSLFNEKILLSHIVIAGNASAVS
jgi:8-oxo-dGTP diphosphatase